MAGYVTPTWADDSAPAINAAALSALGEAVEISEHPYGVCSTAASTAAKTVTIDFSGTLALFAGLTIRVKFTNANTASNPTLSVNGTAASPIVAFGSTSVVSAWTAGDIVTLTYDSTNWIYHSKRVIVLTTAQYNALSTAEKNADILYCITDDETPTNFQPIINVSGVLQGDGAGNITEKAVDDNPTENSNNLVKSGGVYSAIPINEQGYIINGKIPFMFFRVGFIVMVAALYVNPSENIPANTWVTVGYAPSFAVSSYNTKYFGFQLVGADGTVAATGRGDVKKTTGELEMYFSNSISTSQSLFGAFFYNY